MLNRMRSREQCAHMPPVRDKWQIILAMSGIISISGFAQADSVIAPASAEPRKAVAPSAPDEKASDAERFARLQRTIDADDARLSDLKAELESPQGQYSMAEAEFKDLDNQLARLKKDQHKLRDEGKPDDAAALQGQFETVEKKWKLAKDRFAVAIEERKNLVGKIATLEDKLRKDRVEVGRLTGMADRDAARTDTTTPGKESSQITAGPASAALPAVEQPTQSTPQLPPISESSAITPASAGNPVAATLGNPTLLPATATGGAPGKTAPAAKLFNEQPPSPELIKARDDAKAKGAVAQQAQEEAATLTSRIDDLRKLIEQERKSMEFEGKKSDLAMRTERALEQELERKLTDGAHWTDLEELRSKIAAAGRQDDEARAAARDSGKRLDDLQSELADLQMQQILAMHDADKRLQEAKFAQKKVEQLENPFAPKNLARWTAEHGPRLLGCIVGMVFLLWLARRLERRLVAMGVANSQRGSMRERESRTRTVVSVFRNAASTAVVITGTVLVLNELGVNVAVLMGGAAVFGLAVAFGAQNLIRDYFYGFVVLLENQYKLNDVVQIGSIAGQVERITLRMTVLRDLEGNVHFIPNGQISSVCNKTHGWSRALFEIPVAYKEDVDRVMEVLIDVGKQLRLDEEFCSSIIEDPTMLGVDSFADSALIIKFYMKTKPLEQWSVKREMLLRIKKRFDAEQIEIPFPQRTVYYRNLSEEGSTEIIRPTLRGAA